ncbi:hypothetical protein GOBAR_AA37408 [Gossypium barbadense]|uniref:Uncharacterized protein n=1 Tax=Gossypium barbadense TaxID=3634 RepID=A0A2P5VWU7_GOSBA|nr:hypothetical protein GOBAR_AA37408 [Gossypium barbadense]
MSHSQAIVEDLFMKDRRLQVEELDEWWTHKLKTHDKPKLHQNELNTFPNQLKVGDRVLLDVADPHIVTTKPNKDVSLMVLSIFPFGTVEVSHPKFGTFKVYNIVFTRKENRYPCFKEKEGSVIFLGSQHKNSPPFPAIPHRAPRRTFQILRARPLIAGHCINWATIEQTVMTNYDDPSTVQFCLGGLVRQLNVPEFATALGAATYNPSHTKALALPPSLRYLHTILAHTIIGRRESTGVVNTHDTYFLWCMSHGHIIDLAYFIAFAIQHQTKRHRKGCQGTYLHQYRLAQSTGEEAPEDITDDIPPQHEDPPSQPPPPSHPVHAAASYAGISECLTRFEQYTPHQHEDPPSQPPPPSHPVHAAASYAGISECLTRFEHYKELHNSLLLRNSKLHRERFSTTVMSYLTTTIATTRYNILLAHDLWTNETLPPPEYPPSPSH